MLDYRELPPPPPLAQHVRCFWLLRGDDLVHAPETLLPDGSTELIFHLGDAFVEQRDGSESVQPRALFAATLRRTVTIRATGFADIVGVRFQPGGAYRFLRTPMHQLTDQIVDLRDLAFSHLLERLAETPGDEDRVQLISRTLLQSMKEPDRVIDAAVAALVADSGSTRISTLAHLTGATERSLERRFLAHVGVGPKAFARVLRFHAAVQVLRDPAPAADDGYCDDSHRVREFRDLAGITPGQLDSLPLRLSELFAHPKRLAELFADW